MYNNWSEVRMQMDQVLEAEQNEAKIRRQQRRQRFALQAFPQWFFHWLEIGQLHSQSAQQ